jgi:predicted Zn-dependent protease
MGVGSVEQFERGKRAMADDRLLEALTAFESAYRAEPTNAEYQSYYALMHALERGRTREALALARDAAERAPQLAVSHLNLAKVLVAGKDKAGAVEALKRGLTHHPNNEALLAETKKLGVRKPPVFKNLRRDHPLNKYAGKIAHWFRR